MSHDLPVFFRQFRGTVQDKDDYICGGQRLPAFFDADFLDGIFCFADTGGIDQPYGNTCNRREFFDGILVVPGISVTIARSDFSRAFIRDDFYVRPAGDAEFSIRLYNASRIGGSDQFSMRLEDCRRLFEIFS